MNRDDSSRLGERQAEGNLGNERVRSRSTEGPTRERGRESEDLNSTEEWRPSDMPDTGETHDNNDARNGGRDR
jgi:hypothetical protein